MPRQIAFKPALRTGEAPIEITGEETAYGLVLHPTLGSQYHPKHWPTHYAVSDPETGAQICHGSTRMDCIYWLIHAAIAWNNTYSGGFRAALEKGRASFNKGMQS